MWSSLHYGHYEFWSVYDPANGLYGDQKVAFDGPNKVIYVNIGVTELDVKRDLYSAWKEWIAGSKDKQVAAGFPIAFTAIGGDAISQTSSLGSTFFLENGWRIQPYASGGSYLLNVIGNLYTREGDSPFLFAVGASVSLTRASLVDQITPDLSAFGLSSESISTTVWNAENRTLTSPSGPTAEEVATSVWDRAYASHDGDGTFGHLVNYIKELHKRLYIDVDAEVNGDGSQEHPFNNLSSAIDRAEIDGIRELQISGDVQLDRNIKNFDIKGIGLPEFDCNGYSIQGCHFSEIKFKGLYTSGNQNTRGGVIVRDSLLLNGAYLEGFFENCALGGDLFAIEGGNIFMKDCASGIPGTNRPTISMNSGGASQLSVRGYSGGLTIKDCDNVDDRVTVELLAGSLTFDSSCVLGTMVARGTGKFVDETNGATVIDETLNRESLATSVQIDAGAADAISDAVWNKLIADMVVAGSAGERLQALLTVNKYLALQK